VEELKVERKPSKSLSLSLAALETGLKLKTTVTNLDELTVEIKLAPGSVYSMAWLDSPLGVIWTNNSV
jgi:hypothetical protein